MNDATVWDDVAESYRALYGQPDVTIPYPLAADVRIAVVESEIAGMVKVIAAQERTIQRLRNELHTLAGQVVTMEERVKELEYQEERITQLEGASYSANEYLERMEAKMQAWEADS